MQGEGIIYPDARACNQLKALLLEDFEQKLSLKELSRKAGLIE